MENISKPYQINQQILIYYLNQVILYKKEKCNNQKIKEKYIAFLSLQQCMPGKEKENKNAEIPYGFIEKSGQVPRIAFGRNLYRKRKETGKRTVDRQTVGFHVKPVAPASDGLCQCKAGDDNIT